jgi:hypothetical protein
MSVFSLAIDSIYQVIVCRFKGGTFSIPDRKGDNGFRIDKGVDKRIAVGGLGGVEFGLK